MFSRLIRTIQSETAREFLRDQSIGDLLIRRQFRLTQSQLNRMLLSLGDPESAGSLSMTLGEGVMELEGRVPLSMLPAMTVRASLTIAGILTTRDGPVVRLRVESVHPLPVVPFISRIVERIPFLTYRDGLVHCHLHRLPGLDRILLQRVGSQRLVDILILRELHLRQNELTGRVGILL